MSLSAPVPDRRADLRRSVLEEVKAEILSRSQPIEDGALAGIEVVSIGHVADAVSVVASAPLPRLDTLTAEVATPASVLVHAACPRCSIPAGIVLTVRPELVIDDETAVLKLKAKAKARTHVCNQLPLPEAEQTTLDLSVLDGGPRVVARFVEHEEAETLRTEPPYAVCGATESVDVETVEHSVSCSLPHGHDTVDDGETFAGEHVQLAPVAIAWRYEIEVPAEPLRDLLLLVLSDRQLGAVPGYQTAEDDGLLALVESWPNETRDAVAQWASAVHLVASDHDDVTVPDVPAVIAALELDPDADDGTPDEEPDDVAVEDPDAGVAGAGDPDGTDPDAPATDEADE